MTEAENRTLFKNARLLKAFLHKQLAIEKQMMEKERQRIDEERKSADHMFDSTELEIASFSQEVSQLMNSDARQAMKKIQQADEDVMESLHLLFSSEVLWQQL